ncbi:AAA-4 family protein [Planctopirus limnophila DSM 3776]|uniref:AAA-4 family protein n=1 Tax=Planctopirus limnophila (strain ATCC 43296 / DSM 3776 / IFAM 1008 / Mu 290) TaxID=521674 RepID=D5SQL4_PLAL2|nr:ATP-binding protein [Planctopirus limnophila]ADG68476.1 AAA-4 family protein [Planctopirus limnophila DSM 3776]
MITTPEQIDAWRAARSEHQNLEFKEAKNQFDNRKLFRYCVALANEGGGHLLLGIEDVPPRKVVGTAAFNDPVEMAAKIFQTLNFRVEIEEVAHPDGRVLVFHIPSRPLGTAYQYEGAYLMRAGEELVAMSEDRLRQIFSEGQPNWLSQPAKTDASDDEVIALLDTQAYFDLMKLPYPTQRTGVLERLASEGLIKGDSNGWEISNLAAILLAKRLDGFSHALARKAPRVVIYDGVNKLKTKDDKPGMRGYAVGFEALVDFVHSAAPQNRFIEEAVRKEVKMFPKQALRELIANALVHQDFLMTGASVMIEMYDDRVEISNPGLPPIQVERFIDEYRSRNERLADLMRRLGICEEKGSGIDKVISASEVFQLPAPDFRAGELRTTAVLFAHQDFPVMTKADRIRACYQHCCLQYVSGQRMSNQSLRQRFGVDDSKVATVSLVITATKDEGLIKADDSESSSTRYARYLPFWA